MSKIPQSYWRLIPTYFKVKLVDDFADKFIQWNIDVNFLGKEDEFWEKEGLKDLSNVIHMWLRKPYLEIYQFPTQDMYGSMSMDTRDKLNQHADYFEREDDNYVIPYHLFEVIDNDK